MKKGDRLPSIAAADELTIGTLRKLLPKLQGMVKPALTPNETGALLSWQFNVGSNAARQSTPIRLLNTGDRRDAAEQFLVWDMAGGHVVPSLRRRRVLERAVFLGLVDPTHGRSLAASTGIPAEKPSTADLNAAEFARARSSSSS